VLKFAIAGAGYIANIHAAAIHTLAAAELVAVVDRFPETAAKLQKKYQVNKYYATVDDLLQNTARCLVVSTPTT
jgi:predicted dehydrogenase